LPERRQTGPLDLAAVEMALRAALPQAGASALSQWLRYAPPGVEEREIPCPCGHKACYRERRARPVLTAVGEVQWQRPGSLCPRCHHGRFPADAALDIEQTEWSPGVRRLIALVGSEAPFDQGRGQIEWLAGLPLTTKAVERPAEASGADSARREQRAVHQAIPWDLPLIAGEPLPIL
jgi:hypothetical protein